MKINRNSPECRIILVTFKLNEYSAEIKLNFKPTISIMDINERKCDYQYRLRILRFRQNSMLALLIFLLSFSTFQTGFANGSNPTQVETSQQKKLTGKVTDEKGEPLPGVTIIAKGSNAGVITDMDGNYSINMPNGSDVLKFSFIGYKVNEIKVGSRSVVNAVLAEDVKNIDEVVVVGYGTQKKSHLTGSVASLKTEGLDEIPVSDVSQALQGKMAGVTVQQTDPMAGQSAEIRVRRFGSISAAVQPLVLVDRFPIPDGLSSVSSANVESSEVLKGAG